MIKEVVISDAHEGKSLARLTRMKWLVAALLVVALVLGWLAGKPVRTAGVTEAIDLPGVQDASPASSSATAPADGSSRAARPAGEAASTASGAALRPSGPALILERRVDGRITARGLVADASVRDQWLNAIRIGAQGSRVDADFDLDPAVPAAAWDGRLRQLTALTADRRVDRVQLENERLILQGPAVAASYRQETEQLFRAQLPDHFQVEYRTVNPSTSSRPTPVQPIAAPPSMAEAPLAAKRSAESGTDGSPARDAPASAPTAPIRQAQPAPTPRNTRPPANCPARLDRLAANIYFRTDSVALSRAERERLGELGRCMRNRRLSVVGFADSRHDSQYNLDLSLRRAQAVAAAIRAEAPDGASITTSSVGAEGGKSRRDARLSRRVEIRVR